MLLALLTRKPKVFVLSIVVCLYCSRCPPDKSIRQRGDFVRTYRKSYSYLCGRHRSCAMRLRISKSERRDRKAGLQGSTRRTIATFESRRA
jgi:hypothetical protein